ncbi:MAG: hypothetical protein OEM51_12025 [Gammaproteobacteria bacterium]|nr:hypothetical protein [Gammaproteobacteria bacterium]
MRQFNVLFRWGWTFLVVVTLGLAACDGDDGAAGAAGAAGLPGDDGDPGLACWDLNGNGVGDPEEDINGDGFWDAADCAGTAAKVTPLESCGVCHDDGSFVSATAAHKNVVPLAFSGTDFAAVGSFANFAVAPDAAVPADLIVSFSATVDGAAATEATFDGLYFSDGTVRTTLSGEIEADLANLFTNNADGSYSVRIVDGVARFGGTNGRYLVILETGANALEIAAVGDYPGPIPLAGLANSEACIGCHGASGEVGRFAPARGGHRSAPFGAQACVVCHRPDNPATPAVDEEPSYMQFFRVVHGIHNSHNFPDGEFCSDRCRDPNRTGYDPYDVSFPTYMSNCSICHSADTIVPATGGSALAMANAAPVSGRFCFSCHGSLEGFDFTGPPDYTALHFGLPNPETADCTVCHNPAGAASTKVVVADFHNAKALKATNNTLDNGGILWDGADTSLTEGAKFVWEITNVADDKTNLAITWQASYDGVGVDPCNATAGPGAPVFFVGNRIRAYRNYVQGDDFILGRSTSAPGQALNVDVTVDNTECVGNVATTTIPVDVVDAERGRVALGGKPLVQAVYDPTQTMVARVPTPTYDWLVGVGGPAPKRRNVVDTAGKCLNCHIGSLYQHGGDRVDNVDICMLCHNSASNEMNNRVGMGVDASEAYDGKTGETFELKTLLHRVHSAGVAGSPPYVIYRNRGIYAFAPDTSGLPNWDAGEDCVHSSGREGRRVFGADPAIDNSCQPHNLHSADFPRALNSCTACHTEDDPQTTDVDEDFTIIPDQTKAMANTVDAGSTDWDDQIDDVLQGAATTACITCHKDGAAKGHAYQNSWTPQAFPEGRQTIIDAVN